MKLTVTVAIMKLDRTSIYFMTATVSRVIGVSTQKGMEKVNIDQISEQKFEIHNFFDLLKKFKIFCQIGFKNSNSLLCKLIFWTNKTEKA